MVILLLPAFKGNEWTSLNLMSKGYKVSFSVQASSKKEALKLAQNKKIDFDMTYWRQKISHKNKIFMGYIKALV